MFELRLCMQVRLSNFVMEVCKVQEAVIADVTEHVILNIWKNHFGKGAVTR